MRRAAHTPKRNAARPARPSAHLFFMSQLLLFSSCFLSLALRLLILPLSLSLEKQKQALACCVVGLSGERGPDPEKIGGVERLLTPGVQTAANGEQVLTRGEERR